MLPPSPTIDRCKTGVLTPLAFLAGTKLDVFTVLADGPKTAEELAGALSIDADWLRPLLFALAASGLVDHVEGEFQNSDEADHFLVRGKPHFIGDLAKLYEDLWRGAFLAAESVKAGRPLAAHDYVGMSDTALSAFFVGQHPDALLAGWKLADAVDFAGAGHVVDVGGGSGGLAMALCERYSGLKGTVVELPAVAKVAAKYAKQSDASERLSVVACDLLDQPLNGNYDVAVMRSLLQVLGPEDCRTILRNTRQGLAPGATIYILGQIVDDDRVHPENVALFNLVFLSFYQRGRAHSVADTTDWLQTAGYADIKHEITPNALNMMTARVLD